MKISIPSLGYNKIFNQKRYPDVLREVLRNFSGDPNLICVGVRENVDVVFSFTNQSQRKTSDLEFKTFNSPSIVREYSTPQFIEFGYHVLYSNHKFDFLFDLDIQKRKVDLRSNLNYLKSFLYYDKDFRCSISTASRFYDLLCEYIVLNKYPTKRGKSLDMKTKRILTNVGLTSYESLLLKKYGETISASLEPSYKEYRALIGKLIKAYEREVI